MNILPIFFFSSLLVFGQHSFASAPMPIRSSSPCTTDQNHPASQQRGGCASQTEQKSTRPIVQYKASTVMETGPDDSPALRIQLVWSETDPTVWTVLYASTWQRVLKGETQVAASIRVCTDWTTSRSVCRFHDGRVTFDVPVTGKAGAAIQGSLQYADPASGRDVVLPFSAVVRDGRIL